MRISRVLPVFCVLGLAVIWTATALAEPPAKGDRSAFGEEDGERQKMLARYDKDQDGRLSREERAVMMKDRRDAILKTYDKNKNGRLELAERKVWASDQRKAIFARLDSDKDGELTMDEAEKARGRRGKMLSRRFARLDSDGDGAVSASEMEAMLVRRPLPGNGPSGRRGGKGFKGKGL